MKTIRLLLCICLAAPAALTAQSGDESDLLLGIAPGMTMRWQQGTLHATDGYYDCCSFTGGNGIGLTAGLRILLPIGGAFHIRGGANWEVTTSDYSSERKSYPILGQGNTVEYVDLQNDLAVSISALHIEAGLAYRLVDPGLYFTAGPAVTIPFSPGWKQTEQITGPSEVRYLDGSRSKKLYDLTIPGTWPYVSVRFGAGALIPINDGAVLAPEMLFAIPLTEFHPDYDWTVSGIDFTIAVMLRL